MYVLTYIMIFKINTCFISLKELSNIFYFLGFLADISNGGPGGPIDTGNMSTHI